MTGNLPGVIEGIVTKKYEIDFFAGHFQRAGDMAVPGSQATGRTLHSPPNSVLYLVRYTYPVLKNKQTKNTSVLKLYIVDNISSNSAEDVVIDISNSMLGSLAPPVVSPMKVVLGLPSSTRYGLQSGVSIVVRVGPTFGVRSRGKDTACSIPNKLVCESPEPHYSKRIQW